MDFSAKSTEQIFEVFSLIFATSVKPPLSRSAFSRTFFILQLVSNFSQALTANPERGIRLEELERLLAVETGGDELGEDKSLYFNN